MMYTTGQSWFNGFPKTFYPTLQGFQVNNGVDLINNVFPGLYG